MCSTNCAIPPEGRQGVILRHRVEAIKRPAGDNSRPDSYGLCVYPASAKRSSSKADSTISLGSAPTTALGCSPGSKNAMVGMLETPKWPASAVSASTSTFATFTEPSYSAAIWSMTGATCLHGPHHAAQKSTNTGTSEFRTSSSKVSSVTAMGSDISNLLMVLICSLVYFGVKACHLATRSVCVGTAAGRGGTGRGGSDGTRTRGLRRDRPAF